MIPERKNSTPTVMVIHHIVSSLYFISKTPTTMAKMARIIEICNTFIIIFLFVRNFAITNIDTKIQNNLNYVPKLFIFYYFCLKIEV